MIFNILRNLVALESNGALVRNELEPKIKLLEFN